MTKRSIFISILTINLLVSGESIVFKDGQIRTNSILDTSGCNVAIADNNKRIDIPKSTIDYCILLSGDTIRYVNYECVKKRQRIVQRDEDTPQSVLFRFLNSCKKTGTSLPQGCGISFLPLVIQGKSDASFTNPFFESLCEIKGKHLITQISTDSVLKSISEQTTILRYVLFVRRFEDIISTSSDNHFGRIDMLDAIDMSGAKEKQIFTVGEIVIADIQKKEILYSDLSSVKKNMYAKIIMNPQIGVSGQIVTTHQAVDITDFAFTDDQRKKKNDSRTKDAINKNVEKTVHNIVVNLSKYFGK